MRNFKEVKEEDYKKLELRKEVESQYYEDNNCFPIPTGFCGTETDAHLYEQ